MVIEDVDTEDLLKSMNGSIPEVFFFDINPEGDLAANASIGSVVSLPVEGNEPALYGCITNAQWTAAQIHVFQYYHVKTQEWFEESDWGSNRMITIHTSYANLSNPVVEKTNTTVFQRLATTAGLASLENRGPDWTPCHLETLINGMLINAMARTAPNAHLITTLKDENGAWWRHFFPRSRLFERQDAAIDEAAFAVEEADQSRFASFYFRAEMQGFAYSNQDNTPTKPESPTVVMLSGTCLRLSLVVAVFLIAAIFLVPQLPHVGYSPPTPVNNHAPTAPAKDAANNANKGGNGVAATISSTAAAVTASSAPSKPATPASDPSKDAQPTSKTPSNKLEAGQTLSPFHLTSPSGRYSLRLLDSGALSLTDTKTDAELFTSDTEYHWPVSWQVELTQEGVLMLSWSNSTAAPYGATPWISNLLPDCASADSSDGAAEKPVLELLDTGKLHIRAGSKTTCTLHRAADDMGRAAIVYTGFLRTYLQTCKAQNDKLVKTWTGSGGVDVHVFTYDTDVYDAAGDKDTSDEATIAKNLRACFGDALKTVVVKKLDDVKEKAVDPPDVLVKACGADKLNHQLSQWKALYLAAQQVQRYMVEKGVTYDYIYKGRLDLQFWGDGSPALSSLKVPDNGILAPRVALDWTWYSMLHDGELRAGVTDITAFGRPNAMFTYLSLYREFVNLRTVEKEGGRWKAFNTHSREKTFSGQEPCTPEGVLAYWLKINGIAVKTEWRFQMGLLRKNGEVIFTCPEGRGWLCPNFIPNVNQDGTFSS
ncbi:hypothetical protein K4K55_010485 [Colletotrichum sp. SAR 10_96]|nr:hypothetical protein K4K55_010485 [Colletotrichum sp. SAR 10_96]